MAGQISSVCSLVCILWTGPSRKVPANNASRKRGWITSQRCRSDHTLSEGG